MKRYALKFYFVCLILMTSSVARAIPPEALEDYAILGKGKPLGSSVHALLGINHADWAEDYETLQVYGGFPTNSDNFISMGAANTVSDLNSRDAYFLRYDLTFLATHSIGFKWLHQDMKFINSAIDAFGIDYNAYFPWGEQSGMYLAVGGYYRYLKQRWNDPWWAPLNLNTQDQEGFIEAEVGWVMSWRETNFITFDISSRDPFSYTNLDHASFDFTFNWQRVPGFFWRVLLGTRTSATFVGTMYPANIYGYFGFVVY